MREEKIPSEIIYWFREIFAGANRKIAERIRNSPAIHEPHLDLTLIEHLIGHAGPRVFDSGWAIRIDTHYLGGLRHFGNWENADIGVFIFFQRGGELVRQKVALLQSKRLYPTTGEIEHLEEFDYRLGMARLAERDKHAPSLLPQRIFRFDSESRYGALTAHDDQIKAIDAYIKKHRTPVYYLLYNPPSLPLRIQVPLTEYVPMIENPSLGSRVLSFDKVSNAIKSERKGYAPSIADLAGPTGRAKYAWRLEYFMANLLLGCKKGRRVTEADNADMQTLFYRRSGPISATIAVTVEVPRDLDLPA